MSLNEAWSAFTVNTNAYLFGFRVMAAHMHRQIAANACLTLAQVHSIRRWPNTYH